MDKKEKLILVIDDEVEIRNIIKEILSDEGYNTLTAASAKEAKKIVEEQSPEQSGGNAARTRSERPGTP